jgi:hypothetical protein
MKRILLAALAVSALAAPASAQYYDPSGPGWAYPAQSYREQQWREDYRQPPRDYYRPRRDYYYERGPDYGYGPPREIWRRPARRVQVGNICVTSRGSCEYPQYYQLQTPCRCDIPGFGPKRGAILQ